MARRKSATSFGESRGNTRGPGNRKGVDPQIFKRRMQILAQRAADSKRLEKLVSDVAKGETDTVDPKDFLAAMKECATRGFGMPTQGLELTGKDGEKLGPQVIIIGGQRVEF